MFRKKEGVRSSSNNQEVPARLIKKSGANHDLLSSIREGNSYSGFTRQQQQQQQNYQNVYAYPNYGKQYPGREIPSNDISESYLKQSWPQSQQQQHQQQQAVSAPNSSKGVRKFAPAFFSRKKKQQGSQLPEGFEVNDMSSDDEETDIVRLEDFENEHSINPVYLGQLDDSQLNTVEEEQNGNFEKIVERRVEYILSNYQKPPPYPGTKKTKKMKDAEKLSSQLQDQDTPLLKQLLKDKQLTDNASMNNFWQAGPHHHRNKNQSEQQKHVDKLVRRTQHNSNIKIETSKELYEKRNQHYMFKINEMGHSAMKNDKEQNRDAISDIVFPEKGYGLQPKTPNQTNLSASVPDLSRSHNMERLENRNFTIARKPREHIEPGELEAMIAHYRKTSLDNFEPHGMYSESISLYSSEGSTTSYVPPSPYMSAEIPVWLQVYAKASPELDLFLKWKMFRYPELDCWQTMLKRLYKKELEQVVLWFEEYRAALSDELNRQKRLIYQQQYSSYHQRQQLQQQQQQQQHQMLSSSSAARMFDINAVGDNMRKTNV